MKIILGSMTFADQTDEPTAMKMLYLAAQAGHVELDTAHVYNDGKTETLLGDLLSVNTRCKFQIATKVNPWNDEGLKPQQIKRQFEQSLERLGKAGVDLLYLHAPDLATPIEDTLAQCWEFYQAGKFKRFGLSNFAAWQVAEIVEVCRCRGWMAPSVYQGMYNALTRDVEPELFPCLRNYGISFYAYNPLAGGLLTGKHKNFHQSPGPGRFARQQVYRDRYWKTDYFSVLDGLADACVRIDITPTAMALRWLEYHSMLCPGAGDGIILGASKLAHLKENLGSMGVGRLPEELLKILDAGWEKIKPDCFKYFRP